MTNAIVITNLSEPRGEFSFSSREGVNGDRERSLGERTPCRFSSVSVPFFTGKSRRRQKSVDASEFFSEGKYCRMQSPVAHCAVLSFNRLVCSTSIQRRGRSSVKERRYARRSVAVTRRSVGRPVGHDSHVVSICARANRRLALNSPGSNGGGFWRPLIVYREKFAAATLSASRRALANGRGRSARIRRCEIDIGAFEARPPRGED